MWIDFIEMFSGVGGVRRRLEKASSKMAQARDGEKGNVTNIKRSKSRKQSDNSGRFLQGKENKSLRRGCTKFEEGQTRVEGFRCVWTNDNDKYACQIYRKNFGNKELIEADIKTIDTNTIPDHMLLTAGFPCQAFSVAGKRKGFQDTRGTLFYEICRIAEAKRPPLLLLENVKGLLSHDKGLTFQIILESLEELGYLVEWQVLNSKHFGVPQNRERVFIVGHLRGTSSRQIFPIGESHGISEQTKQSKQGSRKRIRRQISSTIDSRYGALRNAGETYLVKVGNIAKSGHDSLWGRVYDPKGLSMNLNAEAGGVGAKTGLYIVADRTRTYAKKGRNLESPKDMTNALSGVQKDNLLMMQLVGDRDNPSVSVKDEAFCLPSNPMSDRRQSVIQNCRIRRLTPTECERLQGFPDGWTEGVSDTQRYKLLGNAVTVNVIEFLGNRLLSCVLQR